MKKVSLLTLICVKYLLRNLRLFLTMHFCDVLVVVGINAELDELSVDVAQTENVIVFQWQEVSANKKHKMRERFDEILRPLGFETSLLVIRKVNSLALYFLCMTLSAVMNLDDQLRTKQLKTIVESLFAFLLGDATRQVPVKRLTWPTTDYERCLQFFSFSPGKQSIQPHSTG